MSSVCCSTILTLDVHFLDDANSFFLVSSLPTNEMSSLEYPSIVFILMILIPTIALGSLMIPIASLSLLMIPIASLIYFLACVLLLIIHLILVGIVLCILTSPCSMLVLKKFVYVGLFVTHYFQFVEFSSLHSMPLHLPWMIPHFVHLHYQILPILV